MTNPQDNMDDDDAAVWERLTRVVKAYEPELPPSRPAKSPKAKSKQPRRATVMPVCPPIAAWQMASPLRGAGVLAWLLVILPGGRAAVQAHRL